MIGVASQWRPLVESNPILTIVTFPQVPVCMLFPELKDAYAVKIKKPMDLVRVSERGVV